MTHDERIWELYRGFTIALFPELQDMVEGTLVRCYQKAERTVNAFEELSKEREEMVRTDSPFENHVPDFEVTAKEG